MGIYLQNMNYSNIDLARLAKILNDELLVERYQNISNQDLECIYSYFIKKDAEDIGYILIIKEKHSDTALIDIGIIKKYRYKGYGKKALNELRLIVLSKFPFYDFQKNVKPPLFAKIESENEVAAKIFSEYGIEIYSDMKTRNFVFPKEKKEQFDYLEKTKKNKILSYIKGE